MARHLIQRWPTSIKNSKSFDRSSHEFFLQTPFDVYPEFRSRSVNYLHMCVLYMYFVSTFIKTILWHTRSNERSVFGPPPYGALFAFFFVHLINDPVFRPREKYIFATVTGRHMATRRRCPSNRLKNKIEIHPRVS